MSNITLTIIDTTGGTIMNNMNRDQLLERVSELGNEKWIFVDGRMVNHNELSNIEIADNATVIVSPQVQAGGYDCPCGKGYGWHFNCD